jgi:single-strand DNA-binding protein
MPNLNKTMIMGHLGRDPELRYTQGGQGVANFSVAVTEKWKGRDGEKQERTTWFRVVAWGQAGEYAAAYLRKGDAVYVEGSIEEREWEDKEGQKRKTWELKAQRVNSLSPRAKQAKDEPNVDEDGDELPF